MSTRRLSKSDQKKLQLLLRDPAAKARMAEAARKVLEPQLEAVVETAMRELSAQIDDETRRTVDSWLRVAFIIGMQGAMEYQRNPPPALLQFADALAKRAGIKEE